MQSSDVGVMNGYRCKQLRKCVGGEEIWTEATCLIDFSTRCSHLMGLSAIWLQHDVVLVYSSLLRDAVPRHTHSTELDEGHQIRRDLSTSIMM